MKKATWDNLSKGLLDAVELAIDVSDELGKVEETVAVFWADGVEIKGIDIEGLKCHTIENRALLLISQQLTILNTILLAEVEIE